MRTLTIKNALAWTAYPVVILVCIGLFMTLKGLGFALLAYTYIPVIVGAASITFLELYNPHIKSWIANKNDVGNDLLFMITVQMILPKLLIFLIAVSIIKIIAVRFKSDESQLPISGLFWRSRAAIFNQFNE